MNTESNKIKRFLVKNPFYRNLLKLRSTYEYKTITSFKISNSINFNTAYCISPYKTGTTYISELFKKNCNTAHEPLSYTTLLHLDDIQFLKKRAAFLNLDLECSGFFAHKLSLLRKFAPDAPVLFLSRSPEDWIGSVINYFEQLGNRVSYNYVARLIFDPICGERIEDFYILAADRKKRIVTNLLNYWVKVYTEANNDANAFIVPLDRVDDYIQKIEEFFEYQAVTDGKAWKRKNKNKKPFFLTDYVDLTPYLESIKMFGYV